MIDIDMPLTKYQWLGLVTVLVNTVGFGLGYFVHGIFGLALFFNFILVFIFCVYLIDDDRFPNFRFKEKKTIV